MSTQIDSRALVSPSAQIDENVRIGPYAVIGDNAKIGSSSTIDSFAQILGHTEVGKSCHIFSYAMVGNIPQDLKYKGDKSFLVIGDNNRIREFVTINPGTAEGTKTIIGDSNLFMAYSHIAHDCIIGNNNVLANSATLAGHVEVEDNVVVGGLAAIHQFCRVGRFAIIGGCSKVVRDIPTYSMCDGHPAIVKGLNLIGLRRAKFSSSTVGILKKAFKILFFENQSLDKAKDIISKELPSSKELDYLIEFVSLSKRGISK